MPALRAHMAQPSENEPLDATHRAALRDTQPRLLHPPYQSTIRRAPLQPLLRLPQHVANLAAPVYGYLPIGKTDNDLTAQHAGEPLGERIILSGRVVDEDGRPVPHSLVEIWQCNAAGRYVHSNDDHPAPIDPNFTGAGRMLTDGDGRYRFVTIKPGAYDDRPHFRGLPESELPEQLT